MFPLAILAVLVEALLLARMKDKLAQCRREIERFTSDAKSFGHTMAHKQLEINRATFLLCGPSEREVGKPSGLPILHFGCSTTDAQIAIMWGYNDAIEDWRTNRCPNDSSARNTP